MTVTVYCNQPPVPEDDMVTTDETQPIDIDVLGNDSDPEGDDITIESITDQPDYGEAEIVNDQITYYPSEVRCEEIAPQSRYTDTLKYNIRDNSAASLVSETSATVTVKVDCLRGDIQANPDEVTTPEDTPIDIRPLRNDVDDEGQPLELTNVERPRIGEIVVTDDTVTYTPRACTKSQRRNGQYVVRFDYEIQDSDDNITDESTIKVTVICNQPPIANDDPTEPDEVYETNENDPIDIDVIENDTDPEDDELEVNEITEQPPDGEGEADTVPGDDDAIRYYPSKEKCDEIAGSRQDGFYLTTVKYTAIESDTTERLISNEAEVRIKVVCIRTNPEAVDDEAMTDEASPVEIKPLENDIDPENDPLELLEVEDPDIGTIEVDDDTVTYIPGDEGEEECTRIAGTNPQFDGYVVEMEYVIKDADDELTDTGMITVTVSCNRAPPEAIDQTVTTNEDTPIVITPTGTDPEGGDLTFDIDEPDVGTSEPNPNDPEESIIYTPDPDICEDDTSLDEYTAKIPFTVQDDDDELTDDGMITVIVECIREKPVANDDGPIDVTEGTPSEIPILENDYDADNPDDPDAIVPNQIVKAPEFGTVVFTPDGTAIYTPAPDVCSLVQNIGENVVDDEFEYDIRDLDDNLVSDPAKVSLRILCTRAGPVAVNDDYVTEEDESVPTFPLENDFDADNPNDPDALTIIDTTDPVLGTITRNPINEDEIIYTPEPGYCSTISTPSYTATYTYTVSDLSDDQLTASATVSILVNCDRNPPIAENDEATTNEGEPVIIDVLENDSDPDGGDISIDNINSPQLGDGATTNPAPGDQIVYTPGDNCDNIPPIQTSYTDVFTYRIIDSDDGLTDTASVEVTVICPRDPIAVDDAVTTPEDTPINIDVLDNDIDPEDGPLEVTRIVTNPENGDVVIESDDTVTYTPDANYCGSDSFVYEIEDEQGRTDQATVSVSVTCEDENPIAVDDDGTIGEDDELEITIDVLENDIDPDGGGLIVVDGSINQIFGPDDVEIVINADDTVTVTPPDRMRETGGTIRFEYTAQDADGDTDVALVTVTVDQGFFIIIPDAKDDTAVTEEGTPVNIDVLDNDLSDRDDEDSGEPLIDSIVSNPSNGMVEILSDGTVEYTPNSGFCNGVDEFDYSVINQITQLTDTATVRVTVNCVTQEENNPPVAKPDEYETRQGVPVRISVLDNDSDPDGDDITVVALPSDGTIDPNEGVLTAIQAEQGIFRFTPDDSFCDDTVTFNYIIADEEGETATTSVSIKVNCREDPCDCYDFTLTSGPTVTGDKVCYGYRVKRKSKSKRCRDPINYFVLGMNNEQCDNEQSDYTVKSIRPATIRTDVNHDGSLDGTEVDGVKVDEKCDESTSFTICFDEDEVGGVQETGFVGFKLGQYSGSGNDYGRGRNDDGRGSRSRSRDDRRGRNDDDRRGRDDDRRGNDDGRVTGPGRGYQCSYENTLPDFCGGNPDEPTTPRQKPPNAVNDNAITDEGTSVTIDVLENDSDPDGPNSELEIKSYTRASNGNVKKVNNKLVYNPNRNYCGNDQFTYTVVDEDGLTDTATVRVKVNCKRNDDRRPRDDNNRGSGPTGPRDDDSRDDNRRNDDDKRPAPSPRNDGRNDDRRPAPSPRNDGRNDNRRPAPSPRNDNKRPAPSPRNDNSRNDDDRRPAPSPRNDDYRKPAPAPAPKPAYKPSNRNDDDNKKSSYKRDDDNKKSSYKSGRDDNKRSSNTKYGSDDNKKSSYKSGRDDNKKSSYKSDYKSRSDDKKSSYKSGSDYNKKSSYKSGNDDNKKSSYKSGRDDNKRSSYKSGSDDNKKSSYKSGSNKSRNDDRSRSDNSKGSSRSRGYRASAPNSGSIGIDGNQAGTTQIEQTTTESVPYILIAIITLLFNAMAYSIVYMFCIRKGGRNKNENDTEGIMINGDGYATVSNKVLDEDDVDDVENNRNDV